MTPWIVLLSIFPIFVCGIKISEIYVPRYHLSSKDVQLNCTYEHTSGRPDPLYSVKWFRGDDHFYEYIPKKPSFKKAFPFPGIKVVLEKSSGSSVVLSGVSNKTSGNFRCEVMGDRPFFDTESKASFMTIIDPPPWGPIISGVRHNKQVRIGDRITARCSIPTTDPPANLTWLINGEPKDSRLLSTHNSTKDLLGNDIIVTKIDLLLRHNYFLAGILNLECAAGIFDVFHVTQKIVLLDIDQPKEIGILSWFYSNDSNEQVFPATYLLVLIAVITWY